MLQDYKLGIRMLVKFPGLAIAGGLALAVAIGIGAGWYDLAGKLFAPTIPLPEGDRIVAIETQNVLTNAPEFRVARDFLEWRRELQTIVDLGAFRIAPRNLIINSAAPERIQMAEITATAFRTARVSPLIGRALLDSDEVPGAPGVVILGYDIWQRAFGGRQDVIGSEVKLGDRPATVVGVMPEGFGYPFNFAAWTPLQLQASYGALEGARISVIGRLTNSVTRAQADAEVRALGARTAGALPASHEHLRPRVVRLDEPGDGGPDLSTLARLGLTNFPALVVLLIACMSVGTLVYARTATREGEIALRSALGATRSRIVTQLFLETLVLASLAAGVGLVAADRILRWGVEGAYADEGGMPFWITPGLSPTTVLYAAGLAIVCALLLSLLPALRVTRARVQTHLAHVGNTGGTLRFGRLWTGVMIAQVSLTALGIPAAMQSASMDTHRHRIAAQFPSRDYMAARLDLDPRFDEEATAAFDERRARTFAELERRVTQEPGVLAVSISDRVAGVTPARRRLAAIEASPGVGPTFDYGVQTSVVGLTYFEAFDRPIVAGRAFNSGDLSSASHAVIVNEAFVRGYQKRGGPSSPIGARVRYPESSAAAPAEPWLEIVGVVRDLGIDLDDEGNEDPYVFHPASARAISPLVMTVHTRGNPGPLAARLPVIAANVDAGWSVQEAHPLDEWNQRRNRVDFTLVLAVITALVLFLSALGIFSLLSVNVSRRTREIGLRTALGEEPRRIVASILRRAALMMGSGIAIGGSFLLFLVVLWNEDVARYAIWLAATAVIMLGAGILASVAPTRRALRINPVDALRDA
jgi:putative ABC transport system permease protein